jgi:CrtC N-terminal lipocalin domain
MKTLEKPTSARLCRLADEPEDYRRLGLTPDTVEAWEDGLRTDPGPGSYEWWYFDAHLDDGSSLVIMFNTKNPMSPHRPLDPNVSVQLNRPGAERHAFAPHVPADQFYASKESCDVRVADNWFRGDLHYYEIHVAHEDTTIDVALTAQVRPWRKGAGRVYFGENDEHYFAWLASVPQGTVSVRLSNGGETERLTGIGYHDHNWGDVAMPKLMNHWYWGRAQAGPYSVIASYSTAEHKYGDAEIPTFLLTKGEAIVADDAGKVSFHLEDVHIDEHTGKPVANIIVYDYDDGQDRYRVSFRRAETIMDRKLIDEISGLKHVLARLKGFDGAYLRFTGTVQLEHFAKGSKVEDVSDHGIWELMYFGRTTSDEKLAEEG